MTDPERALTDLARRLPTAGPPAGTLSAIAERAEREGLLDVAYSQIDSPLGPLTAAATKRGLVTLSYPEHTVDEVLGRIARDVSPRILEAPARLDPLRRELEEYFEGGRTRFDTRVDWRLTAGFFRAVLRATAKIRYGQVRSYAEVAASAGSPRAVRAAGNGLGSNPMPIVVPCHRVVASGGKLGGYTGGIERKEFLLDLERR